MRMNCDHINQGGRPVARKRGTRMPTMTDVAKQAGVSQTTVSFVLNDVATVTIPDETRDRIWAAVRELGYRPNAAAQLLRTRQSHLIGFLTDEIATTPFAVQIIQGAQKSAWANEKLLIVVNTNHDPAVKEAAVEMMLERQVEGILYATMYHRAVTLPASVQEVPTVLVNAYSADRSLPSVVPDEVQGARTATAKLLQHGHRRIGFINNVDPIPATRGRLDGYRQALAQDGVPFDEALVVNQSSTAAGGYDGALTLMNRPRPPTALFCFNDRMAMGAYDALRKLQLRIPHDVSVVGFDNQELIAAELHPGLSTMALPHYDMGHWAVEYLLEHSERGDDGQPPQHRLTCSYIERASVAQPPIR